MRLRSMTVTVALAFALAPAHAQHNDKSTVKAQHNATSKAKSKRVVQGPKQRHQCKVGPYEKQTRVVMETVNNKPVYLAYWSSSGPFHCSFETWPGDGRAHWVDSKAGTVINLISGNMLIERNGGQYLIHANEVDRMPYCGTSGLITGVLTVPVKKGPCDWKEMSADDGNVLKQKDAPADGDPPQGPQDAPPVQTGPSAVANDTGPLSRAD